MDRVVIAQKDNFYCNSESSENSFEGDNNDDFYKVRKGEWSYLRKECETFDLEQFYNTYVERVQRSFLSIFFVLQTLISVTHMILIATTNSNDAPVNPDIICYTFSILLIWITLFPAFKEDLIRKYPWLPFAVSAIAVFTLVITDLIVPLHHAIYNFTKPALRPCYASHVLFVIYIFLPLMNNWHAFVLGLATTLSYLIEMRFITYRLEDQKYIRLLSEAIYLACINLFGIYFRLINEVAIRRQFLDRRNCVQQNLVLKFERNQEKELLLSILPEHTAEKMEKDIRSMIEIIRKEENRYVANLNSIILDQPRNLRTKKQWRMINKMYVEQHNDVSILYADVVNYTQMTTQLPVKTLVETLHELFVKFDEASKEFNVLRIKFLGDCYYCVSGVPIKNKRHAKNCVDLGLRMIKDIRDVRQSRDLNIDMRIGIHSGSIISGVIGACKWQYDIWSSDVNIANKMESTGEPGKVHVTAQTLELLEGEYIFEDGTEKAKEEPTLKKNNIQTFLICPQPFAENNYLNSQEDFTNNRVSVGGVKRRTIHNRKSKILDTPVQRNFMQNSMEQFREIMNQTKEEMARELEKMPIGKFQFNKLFSSSEFQERRETQSDMERNPKLSKISTLFMCFENRSWEMKFLKEPDLMFKYGVLMSFIVYCTIFGIQILNNPSGWVFWTIIGISGLLLVLFVLITWFKKIWDILMPLSEDDLFKVIPPKSKIVQHLYNLSFATINNSYLRTLIYLTTVAILFVCSLIHLRECTTEYIKANDNGNSLCLNPWSVTHCLILAVCMSFLFVRIYFLLKLVIGILILLFYAWIIFDEVSYMYVDSASVNPAIDPKTAHFYTILIATVIFHLIDRQAEYISRVDFSWKQHLLKKHEEAEVTKNTNSILVQNILPAHVADIYINHQLKNEFHNEQYEDVAVMFATITNFDITTGTNENEEGVLRVLNEIICDFDEKLLSYNGPQKIEKIKVAGWTYMAACGLEPSRSDSTSTAYCGKRSLGSGNRISLIGGRRSFVPVEATTSVDNNTRSSPRQSDNVVIVLAEFALELMRVLKKFCDEFFIETKSGRLRVGISHGRVMAGVVGSSKPLYDIWGNAVNMASRMDSTGISGKIQVTEDTAEVLKSFQFKCDYRDNIFVKGRGNIPTYFIDIDDALNFVKTESEDTKL